MRKDQLSVRQAAHRDAIATSLSRARWQPTDFNDLFEKGESTRYEASYELDSGTIKLYANYSATDDELGLALRAGDGRGLDLRIDANDNLDRALDVLTRHAPDVSPINFRKLVAELVRVSPETYAVVDDETGEVRKVIPDDAQE